MGFSLFQLRRISLGAQLVSRLSCGCAFAPAPIFNCEQRGIHDLAAGAADRPQHLLVNPAFEMADGEAGSQCANFAGRARSTLLPYARRRGMLAGMAKHFAKLV